MLISIHVPKTAGSSFRSSLQEAFGDRMLLHYSTQPISSYMRDKAARLRCKFNVSCRSGAFRRYEAIHGHFVADTFNSLPFPKRFCIFLRRPVERVISHYLFWKKFYPQIMPRNSVLDHVVRKQLTIVQFAALPQNGQFLFDISRPGGP